MEGVCLFNTFSNCSMLYALHCSDSSKMAHVLWFLIQILLLIKKDDSQNQAGLLTDSGGVMITLTIIVSIRRKISAGRRYNICNIKPCIREACPSEVRVPQ